MVIDGKETILSPHVLMFPLPLQGPVNCMLKLAELLCHSALHVTFLNTHHVHSRLLHYTDLQSRFACYPHFRFETISDGLPEGQSRTMDGFMEMMNSMEAVTKPLFRELVTSGSLSSKSARPVTCIIADGIFSFALNVAEEIGVSLFYFETISPCALWTYLCVPKLIEAGELPFKGNDLDAPITCVPSMEDFLRRRDLPDFYRNEDPDNPSSLFQLLFKEIQQLPRAKGLILNTFEQLERPVLSQIRNLCPNIYTIGPLHTLFKTIITAAETTSLSSPPPPNSSNSLWEEDRRCMTWLNEQPLASVIYISIGSHAVMTWHQVVEFWHGLVSSGKRFLWVQRSGSITGKVADWKIPAELSKGTKERGCIVGWAPQEEVLAHPAIGVFLTHSGWNSTLESIVEGVPMICWPQFVDQQVNSRFVSEVWKIGVDMKDSCDRGVIEKMVKDVMEVKRDEFIQSLDAIVKLGRESVGEDGSSSCHLNRLIEDIKFISITTKSS